MDLDVLTQKAGAPNPRGVDGTTKVEGPACGSKPSLGSTTG